MTAFGGSFFGSLLFGAAALATGGLAVPNIGPIRLRTTGTDAALDTHVRRSCVLCVFVVIYSFGNGKERSDRT